MSHQAKFTHGSTMRHIAIMSCTSAVGLMALFLVDLLDMYFISLLGHVELAAAIGFAGTLVFFNTSVSIGSSIAMGAMVSKALGAKKLATARRYAASALVFSFIAGCLVTSLVLSNAEPLLALIGAKGVVAEKAYAYLTILMPSAPVLAMAISASSALRATGDARRPMLATLFGGGANAILDPVFIFGLNLGIEGAAWASVIARLTIFLYAFFSMTYRHGLLAKPRVSYFKADLKPILLIAVPAILANIATPFGNALVTRQIAYFGEDYVAGFAVVGRIIPVAFALLFALSGALGPIIGQNYGAKNLQRVQESIKNAIVFNILYCLAVSGALWLLKDSIILFFGLNNKAASLLEAFCPWISLSFMFNGALFIANASFNNLQRGLWATLLNAGKATIGTFPFILIGGHLAGAEGVLMGQGFGSLVFGVLACSLALYRVKVLKARFRQEEEEKTAVEPAMPMTPFCSSRAYIFEESQLCKETYDDETPPSIKTGSP
ncbi:MATE family efflux transporter [Endozoicomonas sp. Mp262]|uniref:MATE family efflux transporter n=1 Tax=Endozoicomonas sp. Mp262 TaxID=2919499 RepID=UPI0021D815AA